MFSDSAFLAINEREFSRYFKEKHKTKKEKKQKKKKKYIQKFNSSIKSTLIEIKENRIEMERPTQQVKNNNPTSHLLQGNN